MRVESVLISPLTFKTCHAVFLWHRKEWVKNEGIIHPLGPELVFVRFFLFCWKIQTVIFIQFTALSNPYFFLFTSEQGPLVRIIKQESIQYCELLTESLDLTNGNNRHFYSHYKVCMRSLKYWYEDVFAVNDQISAFTLAMQQYYVIVDAIIL